MVQRIIAVLNPNRIVKKKESLEDSFLCSLFSDEDERKRNATTQNSKGSMAEWSKAWDSGSHPQGRGFKSLCCHQISVPFFCCFGCAPFRARAISIIARAVYAYWFVFFRECPTPSHFHAHKITFICFPRRRDATRKKSPLFFIIVEEEEAFFWLT